jgi:hypothetical protein
MCINGVGSLTVTESMTIGEVIRDADMGRELVVKCGLSY